MFTGKRRLSRREDASSRLNSPGDHMAALSRLSGATTRYTEARPAKGGVGWLVEQLLPLGHPATRSTHREQTTQARTCWPGAAEKLPDRCRFRPASSIRPRRSTGSPRTRDAFALGEENNQSVLSRLRYNAEFTGKRRLSSREDAQSETVSPATHMAAPSRLSGATTR